MIPPVGWYVVKRRRPDDVLEAHLAEHLHRPQLEMPRARMDCRATVAFDRQRRHTEVAEQHRGRQPDQAAADDQDGRLVFGHVRLLLLGSTITTGSALRTRFW